MTSTDLPVSDNKVCPRCGAAATDNRWCSGCGLNLGALPELPTADAYAARLREMRWLSEGYLQRVSPGHSDARTIEIPVPLAAQQTALTNEGIYGLPRSGAQQAAAPVAASVLVNHPPAGRSKSRGRRGRLVILALALVVVIGAGVTAFLVIGRGESSSVRHMPRSALASGSVAAAKTASPRRSSRIGPSRTAPQASAATPPGSSLVNRAQHPNPSTTLSCSASSLGEACKSGTNVPSNPNQLAQRNCTTSIVANSVTTCSFANNIFYEYYEALQLGRSVDSLGVHSPTTGKDYSVGCSDANGLIGCFGSPLATSIYVSFPQAAITAYNQADASSYASRHDVGNPPSSCAPGQDGCSN
jgi:hypothetical protein